MNHYGIYLHNNSNKQQLIDDILSNNTTLFSNIAGATGVLHSAITIEKIIDEERRHDKFPITTENNRSLESMSSGEQKRELLKHLITQSPDYIILDDWSGSLDVTHVEALKQLIIETARHIRIIQLFYRKRDILPFIDKVYVVDEHNAITKELSASEFINESTTEHPIKLDHIPHLFPSIINVPDPLIVLRNVSVSYNERPILNSINWTIKPGEFWQLKGPNGTGKSTLVSMIVGDNPKAYGQDMMLFGYQKGTGESVWDIKKNIGYFYPAMTLLFPRNDTVENMIISGLVDSIGLYTKPTELQQMTAQAWLHILGADYHNKRFNDLSPGQQRIILVIRAIVKFPPLLILDEPTVGLDDENTDLFVELINRLISWQQLAIIYVSHRMEEKLQPQKILELIPSHQGSGSKIITANR